MKAFRKTAPLLFAGAILLLASSCASEGVASRSLVARSYIAGAYIDALGLQRPCVWTGTALTDLSSSLPQGNQGGVISLASFEEGQAVYSGSYLAASGELRFFSISNKGFCDLGPDKTNHSIVPGKYAPVVPGKVGGGLVGCYLDENKREKPCYWQNGQRINLSLGAAAGNQGGIARSMSARDGAVIIAGFYYDSEYSQKPCIWDNGSFVDLSASLPAGSQGGVANAVVCF